MILSVVLLKKLFSSRLESIEGCLELLSAELLMDDNSKLTISVITLLATTLQTFLLSLG